MTAMPPDPQPRPTTQIAHAGFWWLRPLVLLVVGNYGFWAYTLWSMGRDDGDPTPALVAAFLGLAVSGAAALRWPGPAAWALLLFVLLGWLAFAQSALTNGAIGPWWADLLITAVFFFPALTLAWLARAIGRATRL